MLSGLLIFVILLSPSEALGQDVNLASGPEAFHNIVEKGMALEKNGAVKEAIQAYTQALQINPRAPDVYNLRGYNYFREGRYDEALKDYDQAFLLRPDEALGYYLYINKGVAWAAKNEFKRAIQAYDLAIGLRPGDPAAYNARAYANYLQKKYEVAILDFDRALALKPGQSLTWQIYLNRGVTYAGMQSYEKAIDEFNKALQLNPNDPNTMYACYQAYVNRAYFHARRGQCELANKDLQKARQFYPHDSKFQKNLHEIYAALGSTAKREGEYDRAIQYYSEAISLNPQNSSPYVGRGFAKILKGEKEDALPDLQNACRLGHSNACVVLEALKH